MWVSGESDTLSSEALLLRGCEVQFEHSSEVCLDYAMVPDVFMVSHEEALYTTHTCRKVFQHVSGRNSLDEDVITLLATITGRWVSTTSGWICFWCRGSSMVHRSCSNVFVSCFLMVFVFSVVDVCSSSFVFFFFLQFFHRCVFPCASFPVVHHMFLHDSVWLVRFIVVLVFSGGSVVRCFFFGVRFQVQSQ